MEPDAATLKFFDILYYQLNSAIREAYLIEIAQQLKNDEPMEPLSSHF